MVFNSLTFAAFFAIVLLLFSLPLRWTTRKIILMQETGAPGVHFEDYATMQGYDIPEWSHLATHEKPRMTRALYEIIQERRWNDLPAPPPPGAMAAGH